MIDEIWTNHKDNVLEIGTFRVLDNAPIPVFVVTDDGHLLWANRIVQHELGIVAGDTAATCKDLLHSLEPYPPKNSELKVSDFFDAGKSSDTFQISVRSDRDEPVIWEFFTVILGDCKDCLQTALCLGQDITGTVIQQQHMKELMDQLEQQIAQRTETLNNTIAELEKEIMEKNRISDALTLSRERLKKISRHTLDILEADRQTISKELHDSIGASLAAIKFSLEEKEIVRSSNGNKLDDSLDKEVGYLAATIKETKRISANLRPSTLDDLGLAATIAWYLRQFHRLYGDIKIDYSSEISEQDIPEAMKINIYRIIQEGLTNAERHSNADIVQLSLEYCDGGHSISLSIADNGCGFDVKKTLANKDPLGGYGLVAMRERCEIFGGSFHLDSKTDGGTRMKAILPLK
ncbi:ATP-binding protein [Desulfopila sp. IMCC35008]|uniref:ATP-binding protein n=1 Tax=Desulfopila sp. IMCC35008 TaxID=2653858 RepID=UPI0013CFD4FB|nr:ATP-binding protein [Desulfopila sp. IMCC35008]